MKKLLLILVLIVSLVLVACEGAEGPMGPQGDKGEVGAQGPQGEAGAKGDKGDTGAQGPQGAQGAQGEKGEDGVTPTIEISDDGYWVINGEKTNVKAEADNSGAANSNPQCLEFYPKDDGSYAVGVGSAKMLTNIVIPETYCGKVVSEIVYNGFQSCYNLKSITIPASITAIGLGAFDACTSLEAVYISDLAA